MATINQEFKVHRKKDLTARVTVTDGTNPIDLTGKTIVWRMAKSPGASAWLIEKTTASGITIVGQASEGVIDIDTDPDDNDRPPGVYYHEARFTDDDSDLLAMMTGPYRILPSMIRD